MCKFSSKSGGVPFQPLGDLTWNDPRDPSGQDHKSSICHVSLSENPKLLILP